MAIYNILKIQLLKIANLFFLIFFSMHIMVDILRHAGWREFGYKTVVSRNQIRELKMGEKQNKKFEWLKDDSCRHEVLETRKQLVFNFLKACAEADDPMLYTTEEGRINDDNIFRKLFDDFLLWSDFEMVKQLKGLRKSELAAKYISDKCSDLDDIHYKHCVPFEEYIGKPLREALREKTLTYEKFNKIICVLWEGCLLSKEEASNLDSATNSEKLGYSVRTHMPRDWKYTGEKSAMRRLDDTGISYKKLNDDVIRELKGFKGRKDVNHV